MVTRVRAPERTAPETVAPAEHPHRRGHPGRILARKLRRDVGRQRWQFAAVTLTVLLGVALFTSTRDSFRNLSASYHDTYARLAFADLTVSGGDQAGFASAARSTPGVAAVTTRVQADVPLTVAGHRLLGRVVGMPAGAQPAVDRVDVQDGRYLSPSQPDGVLMERHLADHFHVQPGDRLQVLLADGTHDVHVLGIVSSAEYLWPARSRQDLFTTPEGFGVLFVPEPLAAAAPATALVPQTLVRYEPHADTTGLDRALSRAARTSGAGQVITQADQPSNAALGEDLHGFDQMSFAFPLLFLTAAGMATFVLLNRIVLTQRPVIGTLRANGLSSGQVLRHYAGYGVALGGIGALAGVALGVPLGVLVTRSYTKALAIPDTVTHLHPLTPVVGIAFGLVMGLLAAVAPAQLGARVAPAAAMRGEVPAGGSRLSLFERILPPLRRLPVRWKMALRGIGRSKRRSLSTAIGVVLALVLVLVSWGMIDTTRAVVSKQFDTVQHDDAQVYYARPVDDDTVRAAAAVDGVARAEPVLALPTAAVHGDRQFATEVQAFPHTFVGTSGNHLALPTDGVLVGQGARKQLGVRPGDRIELTFPTLHTAVTAQVRGFVDEPIGTFVYAAESWVADALAHASPAVAPPTLRQPGVASVMVTYQPGAHGDQVRNTLERLPGAASVLQTTAVKDLVDQSLAFFYAFVGMMLVFGALMAFALIFNTISVNIAERSVELATMRANGISERRISRIITGENLLLTLLALPVGLIAGRFAGAAMMSSYNNDLFAFGFTITPLTYALAAAALVLVTLLSQRPGLRAVRRLDIASVVRERAQ
jgi:putative ABC transport system permease protein